MSMKAFAKLLDGKSPIERLRTTKDELQGRRNRVAERILEAENTRRAHALDAELGTAGAREAIDAANAELPKLIQQRADLDLAIKKVVAQIAEAEAAEAAGRRAAAVLEHKASHEAARALARELEQQLRKFAVLVLQLDTANAEIMKGHRALTGSAARRFEDEKLGPIASDSRLIRYAANLGLHRTLGFDHNVTSINAPKLGDFVAEQEAAQAQYAVEK